MLVTSIAVTIRAVNQTCNSIVCSFDARSGMRIEVVKHKYRAGHHIRSLDSKRTTEGWRLKIDYVEWLVGLRWH